MNYSTIYVELKDRPMPLIISNVDSCMWDNDKGIILFNFSDGAWLEINKSICEMVCNYEALKYIRGKRQDE